MDSLRAYYWLTKPGIIQGNLLAAASGYFVASDGSIGVALLLETALAIALIIASACVVNNYMDREIDKVMARTRWRAFPSGTVSARSAFIYAGALGVAGFAALIAFTNLVTVVIGIIGYADYVALYGWSKRRTWHGTLIGSVSGSMPLTAGYTAMTGRFDVGAILLFLLMAFWQMPHFYSIAMRRLKDYKAADIPVLPAIKGMRATKLQIIAYIAAFMITDVLLYATGHFGRLSAVVIGVYAAIWLSSAIKGLSASKDKLWAKKMFLYSLIFLPALFVVTLADALLRLG